MTFEEQVEILAVCNRKALEMSKAKSVFVVVELAPGRLTSFSVGKLGSDMQQIQSGMEQVFHETCSSKTRFDEMKGGAK